MPSFLTIIYNFRYGPATTSGVDLIRAHEYSVEPEIRIGHAATQLTLDAYRDAEVHCCDQNSRGKVEFRTGLSSVKASVKSAFVGPHFGVKFATGAVSALRCKYFTSVRAIEIAPQAAFCFAISDLAEVEIAFEFAIFEAPQKIEIKCLLHSRTLRLLLWMNNRDPIECLDSDI